VCLRARHERMLSAPRGAVSAAYHALRANPQTAGHVVSDEPRFSAHSQDQQRSDGPPAWWSLLDRGDLPDGPRPSTALVHTARMRGVAAGELTARARRRRLGNWAINVAALLVALLVAMAAVGVDSARGAIVVALIFGVPMVLVAVTVSIAARRAR